MKISLVSVLFIVIFNYFSYILLLDPWTETTHFFTLYDNPKIVTVHPLEGKTNDVTEIELRADIKKPFSMRKYFII